MKIIQIKLHSFIFCFQDRVLLCSRYSPGTHYIDDAGLEHRESPVAPFQVLELKMSGVTLLLN